MRTALNIDDQLYRQVKVKAALENRTVTELIESALRYIVEEPSKNTAKSRHRVALPLLEDAQPADPQQEMTPQRIADILLEQETEWTHHQP